MFQMWDVKQYGKLKLIEISRQFIALGISPDEDVSISCLKFLLDIARQKHLSHEEALEEEILATDFLKIFSGSTNHFYPKIIAALNEPIREAKKKYENEVLL